MGSEATVERVIGIHGYGRKAYCHVCKQCAEHFVDERRKARYCSDCLLKRKRKAQREYNRRNRKAVDLVVKKCGCCGKMFEGNKRTVYCKQCRVEIREVNAQRFFTIVSIRRKMHALSYFDPQEAVRQWDEIEVIEGRDFVEYAFGEELAKRIQGLKERIA